MSWLPIKPSTRALRRTTSPVRRLRKRTVGRRWLYVIEGGLAVKIGISRAPRRRLATLQTATPYPLRLHRCFLVAAAAALVLEAAVHTALAARRLRGEWFAVPAALAAAQIQQVAARLGITVTTPFARPRRARAKRRVEPPSMARG